LARFGKQIGTFIFLFIWNYRLIAFLFS
jgi:hypothetical protein